MAPYLSWILLVLVGIDPRFTSSWEAVMLTRPQPHEAKAVTHEAEANHEAKTHEAEAKTHKAEARFFGLEAEAEFEAKFMRRQRFEKPKNL